MSSGAGSARGVRQCGNRHRPARVGPRLLTPNSRQAPMADKVLAIVRETMLHENTLEDFSFRPATGELLLALLQPDDRFQYPEHELLLTFSGLKWFIVEAVDGGGGGEEVLGIECESTVGGYEAKVSLGDRGATRWMIRVTFADLRYQ